EPAVRLAHVEAALRQLLLQLEALRAREHALVARPGLRERLAPRQAGGKMPDREGVGPGRVVFHDYAGILQRTEARPLRTGRDQQIGLVVGARESLAAGAADAGALPVAHGHRPRAIGEHEVEAPRHHHLVTPGLARHPAVLL